MVCRHQRACSGGSGGDRPARKTQGKQRHISLEESRYELPYLEGAMNRRQTLTACIALVGAIVIVCGLYLRPRADNSDVLRIAYDFPNGGGYSGLTETGVAEDIVFKGITILPKGKNGSYCCGYTFAVAVRVAEERGLLEDASPYQLKRFQREWYGATAQSRIKQVVTAMENLEIGSEVYPLDARAGDFIVFSRDKSGHSAVFLEWIKRDRQIVGIRYRSSQPATKGVGDRTEYFTTSGYSDGSIIPKYFFVGRLDS